MSHREYKYIPSFQGINKVLSPRSIPDNKLVNGINVIFKDGKVKRRWGYSAYGTGTPFTHGNTPTSRPITGLLFFETIQSGVSSAIAFTDRDVYRYISGAWKFVTPIVTSNTLGKKASCAGGTTVTAAGNTWPLRWGPSGVGNSDVQNRIQIKFGTTDPNGTGTPDTWYDFSYWTSQTVIDLAQNGPNTGGNVEWVARECWIKASDEDDFWAFAFPTNTATDDKVVVCGDGSSYNMTFQPALIISGTATMTIATPCVVTTAEHGFVSGDQVYFTTTGALPTGLAVNTNYWITVVDSTTFKLSTTYANYTAGTFINTSGSQSGTHTVYRPNNFDIMNLNQYGGPTGSALAWEVYFNHTIAGNYRTLVGTMPFSQTFDNSDTADPYDWSTGAANSYLLADGTDAITAIKVLRGRAYFYKEHSITEVYYTGDSSDPFGIIENKIKDIGTLAGRTVADVGDYHLFLGNNNVYAFNGNSMPEPIGNDISTYLFANIDTTKITKSFAVVIKSENLYCLFVTETGASYPNVAWVFNYKDNHWARWEFAHTFTAGVAISDTQILLGSGAGIVYSMSAADTTDAGTNIATTIETKDFFITEPKHAVRIYEAVLGFTRQTAGQNITVEASTDYGTTWSTAITVDQGPSGTATYVENVVNLILHGKVIRFRIKNVSGSATELESIDIGYMPVGKDMTG